MSVYIHEAGGPLGHAPEGVTCALHDAHRPTPLRLVGHHVWPKGMGGPTTPENIVWICDAGHVNVHELLAALVDGSGELGRVGTFSERELARRGYREWVDAGRPIAAGAGGVPVHDPVAVARRA